MLAVVYLRISEDRSGDEYGITRQREDARKLAAARGWIVVDEFTDNDTSAADKRPSPTTRRPPRVRPEFERMMKLLAAGGATAVIFTDMTRFLRSARDRLRILEFGKDKGTVLAFVRGSDLDLGTPAGRFTADILGAVALHEIEQKADRQRRAAVQAAEQGRRTGGRRPFGYEADGMTIRESEAAAYRAAVRAVVADVPLRRIAAGLNKDGMFTPQAARRPDLKGKPSRWTAQTLRSMLMNPRYAGLRSHVTEELRQTGMHPVKARIAGIVIGEAGAPVRAAWPELVPEETWRAMVGVLSDPDRITAPGSPRALLTGLALCGVCNATVHGGRQPQGHRTYRCSASAGHIARMAQPVDDYVRGLVIERLSRPDAISLLTPDDPTRPDPAALRAEANVIRARLDALAVEFANDDEPDPQYYQTARKQLRRRLGDVETRQTEAGRVSVLTPLILSADPALAWKSLDTDRQRAVVDVLLMPIRLIPPGRGKRTFDPETVQTEWRKP